MRRSRVTTVERNVRRPSPEAPSHTARAQLPRPFDPRSPRHWAQKCRQLRLYHVGRWRLGRHGSRMTALAPGLCATGFHRLCSEQRTTSDRLTAHYGTVRRASPAASRGRPSKYRARHHCVRIGTSATKWHCVPRTPAPSLAAGSKVYRAGQVVPEQRLEDISGARARQVSCVNHM